MDAKASQRKVAERVLSLLRPSYHATYRAVERNLLDSGITAPVRGLLQLLADGESRTVPQIARQLRIPRQFALRLVDEAVALALVGRTLNPDHKRAHFVQITPAGASLIAIIQTREWDAVRPLMEKLPQEDLDATARVLSELIAYFDDLAEAG